MQQLPAVGDAVARTRDRRDPRFRGVRPSRHERKVRVMSSARAESSEDEPRASISPQVAAIIVEVAERSTALRRQIAGEPGKEIRARNGRLTQADLDSK